MDHYRSVHYILSISLLAILRGISATTFTFVNSCDHTVWPGILSSAGSSKLETTGFELPKGSSRSFQAPTGWSGRFWGRTGCAFDSSGKGSCNTADCGSDQIECNGAGAAPPATLAEFTLGSAGTQDFYDVSLVDGYNLPMMVQVSGGTGACASTGCVADLNQRCPAELRVEDDGTGVACRSACEAFHRPEYCCSGAYNTPNTCKPSMYSVLFKTACPRSYSYAYDDQTSTFTCTGANYAITFCPNSASNVGYSTRYMASGQVYDQSRHATCTAPTLHVEGCQKASKDPPRASSSDSTTGVVLNDESLLASLATAAATRLSLSAATFVHTAIAVIIVTVTLLTS